MACRCASVRWRSTPACRDGRRAPLNGGETGAETGGKTVSEKLGELIGTVEAVEAVAVEVVEKGAMPRANMVWHQTMTVPHCRSRYRPALAQIARQCAVPCCADPSGAAPGLSRTRRRAPWQLQGHPTWQPGRQRQRPAQTPSTSKVLPLSIPPPPAQRRRLLMGAPEVGGTRTATTGGLPTQTSLMTRCRGGERRCRAA